MEIGSPGFFQCFGDVHGHTKPIGIESKYSTKIFLIGGWMVGGWMVVVVTSVQKSPTCVHTYTTSKRIELESPCWSGFEAN